MANIEMWKSLLCDLLDCGYLDLNILNDADEDFVIEAIDNLRFEQIPISLNAITYEMFSMARMRIATELEVRIDELGSNKESGCAGEYELTELEAISALTPEEDIEWYCNCLDTGIYIANDKYDVYMKYFKDLMDELENKMGFEFGC